MSGIVAKIVLLQLCDLAAALPMLEKGGQILEQQGWWISIVVNLFLVLLMVLISGLYAGLTLGLMALDETSLEVIKNSGTERQKFYAMRIASIKKDGYLLLVTLLLASTILNETLPIVADRFFGTGLMAVILSTVLVLLFAEILPQALCTKYALTIGGRAIWLVRLSIFCLYPLAYPLARLLEWLLGSSHGIVYRRAELKELVSIMGGRIELSPEEVKTIRGVLDLRDKHPALIMTPLDRVFMLNTGQLLDPALIKQIIIRGYSRIPVYAAGQRENIVGILLVKRLLAFSLGTPIPVEDVPLSGVLCVDATQSLFSILREFQQGKSHLAIVVGDGNRPIGIITLEDIIEELLQEEIVDETDTQRPVIISHPPSVLDLVLKQQQQQQPSTAESKRRLLLE